jgi:hypothetical protein
MQGLLGANPVLRVLLTFNLAGCEASTAPWSA